MFSLFGRGAAGPLLAGETVFKASLAIQSSKSVNLGECLREARSLLKAKLRLREAKLI
jgi:hypothetical protein